MNETSPTAGSATSASPTSAPPGSTLNRPAGSPASSKIRASATPPATDVRGSGLRITALPSASAGATARIDRMSGKLNGEITPTTPIGTRRVMLRCGAFVGSSSPYGSEVRPAASWQALAANQVSRPALGGIAPVSRTIQPLISSVCCCPQVARPTQDGRPLLVGRASPRRAAPRAARAAAVATSAGAGQPDPAELVAGRRLDDGALAGARPPRQPPR